MNALAAILAVVVLGSVFALARGPRKSLVAGREDIDLPRLHATTQADVPLALFEHVFRVVAGELHIRPGQLRPSDTLASIFKVDSWELGEAQDALEVLIRRRTPNTPPPLVTVQDLLNWLASEERIGACDHSAH
ncbi:hypothetical protein L2Y96_12095 [Luteibacter aegosomaticola]|uniref:hypothetical protein n=1 Tax=Luteibacter aegosomaticola TaxID=2911538 RepID=UPI001FF9B779|nr:hypothetical protein [Luteibacter aegosomaticola]UPG88160.1 hypothetical protein L2Y96_12095 [Luteibacter aegosomaticola]